MFLPFMLALPIFPVRLQTSIFGRSKLNFRVRNGNGWTLALISTNLLSFEKESKQRKLSPSTSGELVFLSLPSFSTAIILSNFQPLVKKNFPDSPPEGRSSNHKPAKHLFLSGDPYGNRTHVCGVRGRRLNRLTNGPCGAPSGIRTRDPLIKSQLLYQLS